MALVDPNIAMSFKPTTEYQPRNVLAEYAQLQQIQGGQMQLEKVKRDEEALTKMMQAITAKGGPEDPLKAADEMIKSRIPEFMSTGIALRQKYQDTQQARAALGLPPIGAAAKPAIQPNVTPGALGSGTFDPMASTAPTNALAATTPTAPPVAPTNALAATTGGKSPEELRALEMMLSPNAAVAKAGEAMYKNLTELQTVAPGGSIVVGGKPIYTAPMQRKSELLTPEEFAQQAQLRVLGRTPGTTVNISNEKKFGEAFAKNIADADVAKLTAAEGAPRMAQSANRILELANKPDVFTGPAANVKLNIARGLNVVGANNQQVISNTEQLIAATGQSTLDAIKGAGLGAGQGFTDKDLKFLQGVAGGTIELTSSTLKELARLQHLTATKSAESWNKRVKQIPSSAIEGTGLSLEPITVPPLFKGAPTTPRATTLTSQDRQALEWANSNPKDPRALQIKQRLGQ